VNGLKEGMGMLSMTMTTQRQRIRESVPDHNERMPACVVNEVNKRTVDWIDDGLSLEACHEEETVAGTTREEETVTPLVKKCIDKRRRQRHCP